MHSRTPTYKIRQVIDLTGASEFLLRVWEHRYSALAPARTKTGRRLYTEADVMKAQALLALTQQGHRVGEIAKLSLTELNRLIGQNAVGRAPLAIDPEVKKIVVKTNAFKWQDVDDLILQQKKTRQPLKWIHELIVPLLAEMGRQVDAGKFSIAQEHILSAIIKKHLAAPSNQRRPLKNAPRFVFATPEGDFHDIGIMMASFIAADLRLNTLFLGPHVPKNELAAVCVRFKATHLLISSTVGPKDGAKDEYLKYLHFLDRNLDPKIAFWLAGKNTQRYSLSLKRPHKIINSFVDFESEVKKCLRSH